MRKDLKIGMAIGAVLLVLVIVYFAVPDEGTGVAQNPADPAAVDTAPQTDDGGTTEPEPKATETPAASPLADATGTDQPQPGEKDPFEEKGASNTDWGNILDNPETPISITATPRLSATGRDRPEGATVSLPTPAAPEAAPAGTATLAPTGDAPKPANEQPGNAPDAGATADDSVPARVTSPETGAATVAPTTPTSPATTGGARTHTIARGETFSSIAALVYKDERQYLAIQEANPTIDPRRVRPGMVINLPDPAAVKSTDAAGAASPAAGGESATPAKARREAKPLDPATEHKVQPGDSLYKIAVKRYGTSNMTDDLYELNKAAIGNDSARLKVGMVLKLPPNPTPEVSAR